MVSDTMTYRQLDTMLTELGFARKRVEPKWLRYEHAATDTVIILVEKKSNQRVRVTDAISAKRHLVEKGLVREEEIPTLLTRS